jgi:hypothetical protein
VVALGGNVYRTGQRLVVCARFNSKNLLMLLRRGKRFTNRCFGGSQALARALHGLPELNGDLPGHFRP